MNILRLGFATLTMAALAGCAMQERQETPARTMAMNADCATPRQMAPGESHTERRAMMRGRMSSLSPDTQQQTQELDRRCP
jgi:hypothetical protein